MFPVFNHPKLIGKHLLTLNLPPMYSSKCFLIVQIPPSEGVFFLQVTLGYPRFSVIATLIISWLISDWLSSSVLSQRMHLPANWDSAAGSNLNEDCLVARRFFWFWVV